MKIALMTRLVTAYLRKEPTAIRGVSAVVAYSDPEFVTEVARWPEPTKMRPTRLHKTVVINERLWRALWHPDAPTRQAAQHVHLDHRVSQTPPSPAGLPGPQRAWVGGDIGTGS